MYLIIISHLITNFTIFLSCFNTLLIDYIAFTKTFTQIFQNCCIFPALLNSYFLYKKNNKNNQFVQSFT